jgi:hypothetical protein
VIRLKTHDTSAGAHHLRSEMLLADPINAADTAKLIEAFNLTEFTGFEV